MQEKNKWPRPAPGKVLLRIDDRVRMTTGGLVRINHSNRPMGFAEVLSVGDGVNAKVAYVTCFVHYDRVLGRECHGVDGTYVIIPESAVWATEDKSNVDLLESDQAPAVAARRSPLIVGPGSKAVS